MARNQRQWWRRVFPTAHKVLLERRLVSLYRRVYGRALIVGAGKEPYRELLRCTDSVVVSDVGESHCGLDHIADVHLLPYADESFDCVLAIEVFEHLRDPERAAAEIRRVLRPGGKALLTIPFMFHIHADPYDYQRLTQRGLETLFNQFSSVEVRGFGGRTHVISDILTTTVRPFAMLRCLNWIFCLPPFDRSSRDCPSGYILEVVK